MRKACLAALVATVLVAPCAASAAPLHAILEISTGDPVLVDGPVAVSAPGGVLHVKGAAASSGSMVVTSGTLRIYRVEVARAQGPVGGDVTQPTGPYDEEVVDLAPQSLRLATADDAENTLTIVSAPTGRLVASGTFHDLARPTRMPSPFPVARSGAAGAETPRNPWPMPPTLDWRMDAGWPYLGTFAPLNAGPDDARLVGRPELASPRLDASGPARIQAFGGVLSFLDHGARRDVRLGTSPATPAPGGAVGLASPAQDWVHAVLDVDLASADLPLSGSWLLASPTMTWRLDGQIAWTDATGSVSAEGSSRSFEHASVRGAGAIGVRVAGADSPSPAADDIVAEGEWTRLVIDDEAFAPSPRVASAEAAGAAVALALLASFWLTALGQATAARVAFRLFSRIRPSAILDHPKRAAILAAVTSDPGIRLRALNRAVGGAWGPFTFHLEMLKKAGLVTVRKEAGYAGVFAVGPTTGSAALPLHPLRRKILGLVPSDGAPVSVADLRSRMAESRQIIDYHLRRMCEDEILVESSEGARQVRRKT